MNTNDEFLQKIYKTRDEMTYPMAFNLLQRQLKDTVIDEERGLLYRIELAKMVWEYLTRELPYDFSPATYRAMRKVIRPHMEWVLSHCGKDPYYMTRAHFFMALSAATVSEGRSHLAAITIPSTSPSGSTNGTISTNASTSLSGSGSTMADTSPSATSSTSDQQEADELAFLEAIHSLSAMFDAHEQACGQGR